MSNSENLQGGNHNKPAVVFHNQNVFGNNCQNIYANGYWSSPNYAYITPVYKSNGCSNGGGSYTDEVRLIMDRKPSTIYAGTNYFLQLQYQDSPYASPTTNTQFTLDTYWLDWNGNATTNGVSPQPPTGKDFMDKICLDQNNRSYPHPPSVYYHPYGNYTC